MGMFENSSLPPPIYSDLYTAELSERLPNRTVVFKIYNSIADRHIPVYICELKKNMFSNELEILSRFEHENIIPLIGYCNEGTNKILFYEHAINGSLRDHLQDKLMAVPYKHLQKLHTDALKHRAAPSTITTRSLQYEKLEDLLIPLKEINLATRDFSRAYEIGDEMILVYEYANNGSLDYHLKDKNRRRCLTWVKRLKICLGAAKGLEYLHTGLRTDSRVIHRDVKSGNILLNENMEAKICDFGLSKSDPSKQQLTKLYTSAAGTNYYTDPIYHEGGVLRPDLDVYSFGAVMFGMLSGMLAWYRRKIEMINHGRL
nr:putative receptor-like protein kinase At5g39000 [Tanacetum cinerariifolium]